MTNRWAPDGACAQQDPPLDAGDNNDVQQKTMWDCGYVHILRAGGLGRGVISAQTRATLRTIQKWLEYYFAI